jgi:hypothetical protein
MDDLRLFEPNKKSSQDPSSNDPRKYVVYVFSFVALTAIIAVWTHLERTGSRPGIATEVLFVFYCADCLIAKFSKTRVG